MSFNTVSQAERINLLAQELHEELMAKYGAMLFGKELHRTLGYATPEAFRQAVSKNTVPVPIFSIKNRRGKFALSKDVAKWLSIQRVANVLNSEDILMP